MLRVEFGMLSFFFFFCLKNLACQAREESLVCSREKYDFLSCSSTSVVIIYRYILSIQQFEKKRLNHWGKGSTGLYL